MTGTIWFKKKTKKLSNKLKKVGKKNTAWGNFKVTGSSWKKRKFSWGYE